jgi:hypothetical protein
MFCGATSGKATDEHAIPKWAREVFGQNGELTVLAGKGPAGPREPAGRNLKHLNIVLRNALCGPCNNVWLAGLERQAAPALTPMALTAQPVVLDART